MFIGVSMKTLCYKTTFHTLTTICCGLRRRIKTPHRQGKLKIMNEFNKNEQMERLARLSEKQPDAISSEQRMSLGIYESTKPTTNGLSADDRLRLAGLKQRIATDVLSPSERTSLAIEISNLEKNTGDNK
jgi:hypothetical protein